MRAFVAVVPPDAAVEDLDDFLEPRRDVDGPRWSPPGQWHVTLAFLADVPEYVVESLVDAVGAAAARHPRSRLGLAGGGCFPDVARARLLWAGVDGGDALTPLARAVRMACAHAGGDPDGGRFRPHLTLARFPRPVDASRWVRVLDTYRGPSWEAAEVVVVQSHLPRERGHRPRHEVLARLPLGAAGVSPPRPS